VIVYYILLSRHEYVLSSVSIYLHTHVLTALQGIKTEQEGEFYLRGTVPIVGEQKYNDED